MNDQVTPDIAPDTYTGTDTNDTNEGTQGTQTVTIPLAHEHEPVATTPRWVTPVVVVLAVALVASTATFGVLASKQAGEITALRAEMNDTRDDLESGIGTAKALASAASGHASRLQANERQLRTCVDKMLLDLMLANIGRMLGGGGVIHDQPCLKAGAGTNG